MSEEIGYNIYYEDAEYEVKYSYLKQEAARFHFEIHPNSNIYEGGDVPYFMSGYIGFTGVMKVQYNPCPINMNRVIHYRIGTVLDYIMQEWKEKFEEVFKDLIKGTSDL
tara:strand:+ start:62 stop:388 length:327 start_codon:yes stop_codon:yes gene_type:complete